MHPATEWGASVLDCKQAYIKQNCILGGAVEVLLFPDKSWWAERLYISVVT